MLYQNNHFKDKIRLKLLTDIEGFSKFSTYEMDDDIYLLFGNLGSYIQYCIENEKVKILNQIFQLINELLVGNIDDEFENMITVQVFEMLYDKKEYFEKGYNLLNNHGQNLLLSIKDNFRPFS